MKKIVLIAILQIYFSLLGFAQPNNLYDIFPLHNDLVYQYQYNRFHYGNDPTVLVEGKIAITCLKDSLINDTSRVWHIKERNQLTITIIAGFYGDTTIFINDSTLFSLTESLSGNHLITIPKVIIFNDQLFGSGWKTHSPWSNISVERFSFDSTLTQIKYDYSSVFSNDTLTYTHSIGLNLRNWTNEWVGTSFWIDHLSASQLEIPTVEVLSETEYFESFLLQQNYPNPFNPSTKISWQSPVGSWQTIKVFDVLGNEVVTLANEYKNAGSYEVEFKSTVGNHQLANGVYFYQLQAGDYLETKKMILLK